MGKNHFRDGAALLDNLSSWLRDDRELMRINQDSVSTFLKVLDLQPDKWLIAGDDRLDDTWRTNRLEIHHMHHGEPRRGVEGKAPRAFKCPPSIFDPS
jgi:hypothetical protein